MNKLINLVIVTAIACLALFTFQSCAYLPQGTRDVLNNPAVKAEIARLEQQAISYVTQWILSNVGNRSVSIQSPTMQVGIGTVTGKMAAENPGVNRDFIETLVTAAFAEKMR